MPTIKQIKAFKEVTENHRPVSRAMLEVGYDPDTASKPSNLTNSKGWQELMEKHLPDKLLAKKHKEGLDASEEVIMNGKVVASKPDYGVRHKYLDSAYKLKGKYVEKESNVTNNTVIFVPVEIMNKHGISKASSSTESNSI